MLNQTGNLRLTLGILFVAATVSAFAVALYSQAELVAALFLPDKAVTAAERTGLIFKPVATILRAWHADADPATAKRNILAAVSDVVYRAARPARGVFVIKTYNTGSDPLCSVVNALAMRKETAAVAHPDPDAFYNMSRDEDRRTAARTRSTDSRRLPGSFDVWCHYASYDNDMMEAIVPTAERTLVSMIRNPSDRMRDVCLETGCCPASPKNITAWANFVLSSRAQPFFENATGDCELDRCSKQVVGRGMAESKSFARNFKSVVRQMREGAWFLLVEERMYESMLAFAQEYKLHILDVTFRPLGLENYSARDLTPHERLAEERMQQWNPWDYDLHKWANVNLNLRINAMFGQLAGRYALEFTRLNGAVNAACSKDFQDVAPQLNPWCRERGMGV